jgi:hypothetical protein
MLRRATTLLVVAALSAAGAGCGGDDENASDQNRIETTPALTETETTPRATPDTIETVPPSTTPTSPEDTGGATVPPGATQTTPPEDTGGAAAPGDDDGSTGGATPKQDPDCKPGTGPGFPDRPQCEPTTGEDAREDEGE